MSETIWIILVAGAFSYLTRVGGHLILIRFHRIHPRVEMALNSAPAAFLTALVAPTIIQAGPMELLALAIAALAALRFGVLTTFLAGVGALIAMRYVFGA